MKMQDDPLSESIGDLSSIATDESFMIVHDVENKLQDYQPRDSKDDTVLVLRAFLTNLPQDGKNNILDDIRACGNDDELRQHASSLVEGLLFPIRVHQKKASTATTELVESASQGSQKWLKKACLARDGNMCAITHAVEARSVDPSQTDVLEEADTECAHIIPFSLASWNSDAEQRTASGIWVNLNRCFPSLRSRINFTQASINDTRNAITMDRALHFPFGRFDIALEATDQIHTYRIQNYTPRKPAVTNLLPASGLVTFVNHSTSHELPSPALLEFHAIIARILHATGKVEQVDKLQRDKGDVGFLARDVSTDVAALLSATSLAPLSGSRSAFVNEFGEG